MMVATNATRAIALDDVAATDTDTVVKVSLDQMPPPAATSTPSSAPASRTAAATERRSSYSDGTVGLTLQCQAVTGAPASSPRWRT